MIHIETYNVVDVSFSGFPVFDDNHRQRLLYPNIDSCSIYIYVCVQLE